MSEYRHYIVIDEHFDNRKLFTPSFTIEDQKTTFIDKLTNTPLYLFEYDATGKLLKYEDYHGNWYDARYLSRDFTAESMCGRAIVAEIKELTRTEDVLIMIAPFPLDTKAINNMKRNGASPKLFSNHPEFNNWDMIQIKGQLVSFRGPATPTQIKKRALRIN